MQFDYDQYGSAFVDMRLHKLRSLVTAQFDMLFEEHDIEIPSACVSVILFLAQGRRVSISQIAESTGYSHQLISQRLSQLEALSLAKRVDNTRDRRKWLIALTKKGRAEAARVESFLSVARRVVDDLFLEIGVDLDLALIAATDALILESVSARANRLGDESVRPRSKRIANAGK